MANKPPTQRYNRPWKARTAEDNGIEREYARVKDFEVHTEGEIQTILFRVNSPRCGRLFRDGIYQETNKRRFNNEANRRFLARLYKGNRKTNQVAIIFNGLDETVHTLSEHVLFSFYDELGRDLASNGVRAILLPTPYHMNRVMAYFDAVAEGQYREKNHNKKDNGYVDYTVPTNALMNRPYEIYRNHFQGFKETIALCRCLRPVEYTKAFPSIAGGSAIVSDPVAASLRDELDSPCQITLIGYSLGGLRAITEFIHDRLDAHENKREPLFTACVAINSGGALSDLPAPPWVNTDKWAAMLDSLTVAPQGKGRWKAIPKKEHAFAAKHFKILEDVFLNKAASFQKLASVDARFASEMLFILGGRDNIVRPESLNRFGPKGGINLFQVAGKGHKFRYRAWGSWQRTVFGLISEFIDATCGARLQRMDPNRLMRFVSLLDHALGILPYRTDVTASGVFEGAVKKIKNYTLLAQKVFGKAGISSLVERMGPSAAAKIDERFRQYAENLVRVLHNRVREHRCDPGAYKQTRSELLFGHFVMSGPSWVDNIDNLILADKKKNPILADKKKKIKKRIVGDILRESPLVPNDLITAAEKAQPAALNAIREEMRQDFLMEM